MSRKIPCPNPECREGWIKILGLDGEPEHAFCPECDGEGWVDEQDYIDAEREMSDQIRKELR